MLSRRRRSGIGLEWCCLLTAIAFARTALAELPAEVLDEIRARYVSPDTETRYLSGTVDLNADGRPELIVRIIGPMACGSGGCPTLVYSPDDGGYRLVSSISVTQLPVRASATSTAGWRNLIVHIAGGGAAAADVELMFDGKTYPPNPTVKGPLVKAADLAGSAIVIDEIQSFDDAEPLPATAAGADSDAAPSFDCGKATAAAEKLICGDTELARLDRALAEAYAAGLKRWPPEDRTRERDTQRTWLRDRNACAGSSDAKDCIKSAYRRRLVELQIRNGELEAPKAVAYVCDGHEGETFQAAFYNQTDPQSAVLTFGDRQEIVFIAPSGSGARYTNPRVELWEHQGAATVKWSGQSYVCKVR